MRTLKLTLAYDGTNYAGWQFQPDRATVQGAVESAIQKVTGEQLRVIASGRTDAGVHAKGQVVSFSSATELQPDVFVKALNGNLPRDIAVLDAADVPADFHAIASAVRKRYRYLISDAPVRDVFARRYCWQYPHALDVDAMQRSATALKGKHDFSGFESSGAPRQSTVRTVNDLTVRRRQDGKIEIEVEADGFLYNMVRAIVGTLVEVGRGAENEQFPQKVLEAGDRKAGGPTAPPEGLILLHVDYGE